MPKKAKDSLLKSLEGAWPYSCTDALISTSGFQNGKRINRLFKASQSVGVVGSPGELRHLGFSGTSEKDCLISGYQDILLLTQWEQEIMNQCEECPETTNYSQ